MDRFCRRAAPSGTQPSSPKPCPVTSSSSSVLLMPKVFRVWTALTEHSGKGKEKVYKLHGLLSQKRSLIGNSGIGGEARRSSFRRLAG